MKELADTISLRGSTTLNNDAHSILSESFDVEFAFDDSVVTSRVYRRALGTALRRPKLADRSSTTARSLSLPIKETSLGASETDPQSLRSSTTMDQEQITEKNACMETEQAAIGKAQLLCPKLVDNNMNPTMSTASIEDESSDTIESPHLIDLSLKEPSGNGPDSDSDDSDDMNIMIVERLVSRARALAANEIPEPKHDTTDGNRGAEGGDETAEKILLVALRETRDNVKTRALAVAPWDITVQLAWIYARRRDFPMIDELLKPYWNTHGAAAVHLLGELVEFIAGYVDRVLRTGSDIKGMGHCLKWIHWTALDVWKISGYHDLNCRDILESASLTLAQLHCFRAPMRNLSNIHGMSDEYQCHAYYFEARINFKYRGDRSDSMVSMAKKAARRFRRLLGVDDRLFKPCASLLAEIYGQKNEWILAEEWAALSCGMKDYDWKSTPPRGIFRLKTSRVFSNTGTVPSVSDSTVPHTQTQCIARESNVESAVSPTLTTYSEVSSFSPPLQESVLQPDTA